MDRTVTRRPTYGAFLAFACARLAPWRVVMLPAVLLTTIAYGLRLFDRGRLKEMNYRLLVGRPRPERLLPVIESFADRQARTNILAGARDQLPSTAPPGGGW